MTILARRLFVFVPLVALILGLLPALWQVEINNASWLPAQHPAYLAKRYLEEEFQSGEELQITIRPRRNYFSQELLDELHGMYEVLQQHPLIRSVLSPLHSSKVFKDGAGQLHILNYRAALEQGLLEDMTQYRQHLIRSGDWGQLIARDANAFAVVITIDPGAARAQQGRQEAIELIREILDQSAYLSDYDLGGEAALFHQLDSRNRNALVWLLPTLALLMVVVLGLACRRFLSGLVVFLVAVLVLLLAFNLLVFNGYAINLVNSGPFVLLPGVAIINAVHILARWRYLAHIREGKERLLNTLRASWLPCLATSCAAALSFGVFYPSALLPLSQLGLIACMVLLLAYPIVFVTVFAMLLAWHVGVPAPAGQERSDQTKPSSVRRLRPPWICQATEWLQKWPLPIVLGALLGGGYFVFHIKDLPRASHFVDLLLPQASSLHRAHVFADQHLSGSGAISLLLPKEDQAFNAITGFNTVVALAGELARARPIRHVNTYVQPIALVHTALNDDADGRAADLSYPATQDELTQALRVLRPTDVNGRADLLAPYVDARYAVSHLQLRIPKLDFVAMEALIQETLRPLLAKYGEAQSVLTGSSSYFHTIHHQVGRAQLVSFIACFILIWLLLMILFGLALGSAALLSAVLPVGIVLGSMALLRLPFDLAAVLVACIGLGLGAGNNAHYLHCYNLYQRAAHRDATPKYARPSLVLPQVSNAMAWPICCSALVLLIGLGLLSGTNLLVMMRFGWFGALTIGLSLLSVFIVLPCLLTLVDRMAGPARRLRSHLAFRTPPSSTNGE